MLKISKVIKSYQLNKEGLYCLIGKDRNGVAHFCDLATAQNMLVGGRTGSGKSVFLHGIILSLILRYTPDEVGLALIDTKKVEFSAYEQLPHLFCTELQYAEYELERRLKLVSRPKKQKSIVVVIDEFALLTVKDKKIVENIALRGEGVDMYVVIATQRATKSVIGKFLRKCIYTNIACSCENELDSRFIFRDRAEEKITSKGEILYESNDYSQKILMLQSFYTPKKEREEIVTRIVKRYGTFAHKCPVCGKFMFRHALDYDICPVCGWEDDLDYSNFPDDESPANGCTIAEKKAQFEKNIKENKSFFWLKSTK